MLGEVSANVKGRDDGYLFPTATVDAKASFSSSNDTAAVESSAYSHGQKTLHTKTEWLSAEAGAKIGSYVGADAKALVYSRENESAKINVGLGVSTGAGIQNQSAEVKVFGCGVSIGREVGFSFFDTEFKLKLW
jgi:hypothetical protein